MDQETTIADLERTAAQKEAEWRADLESKEFRLRSMEEDNAKLTEALGKVHAAEEVSLSPYSCNYFSFYHFLAHAAFTRRR